MNSEGSIEKRQNDNTQLKLEEMKKKKGLGPKTAGHCQK